MSFPYHIPKETGNTRRLFPVGGIQVQAYNIPLGCKMLIIIMAGGGGGGGNGFSAAAGAARGGGGGGGGGVMTRVVIPTAVLPDTLYVQVGPGGGPNTSGGETVVGLTPNLTAATMIARSAGGGGGGNGSGTAAGTVGAASTLPTTTAIPLFRALGSYTDVAGGAGSLGGAQTGAGGPNSTYGVNGIPLMGGPGGGGTTSADFTGGQVLGAGLVPNLPGGAAGTFNGLEGFVSWLPPAFGAGTGGGASNTGNGGSGGPGGHGCGGGGGGGGVVGGAGGRGGDGFVLITALF